MTPFVDKKENTANQEKENKENQQDTFWHHHILLDLTLTNKCMIQYVKNIKNYCLCVNSIFF